MVLKKLRPLVCLSLSQEMTVFLYLTPKWTDRWIGLFHIQTRLDGSMHALKFINWTMDYLSQRFQEIDLKSWAHSFAQPLTAVTHPSPTWGAKVAPVLDRKCPLHGGIGVFFQPPSVDTPWHDLGWGKKNMGELKGNLKKDRWKRCPNSCS